MAIQPVLEYPHSGLRQKTIAVHAHQLHEPMVQSVINDLRDTLYAFPGTIGLAAPQIDAPWRIIMIDMSAKTTRDAGYILINPEIVEVSRKKMVREGCLSLPEYLANVKRYTRLTVRYLTPEGETVEKPVRDLEAVAIQHEIDHLDGVLMIDQVHSLKTDLIRRATALMSVDGP